MVRRRGRGDASSAGDPRKSRDPDHRAEKTRGGVISRERRIQILRNSFERFITPLLERLPKEISESVVKLFNEGINKGFMGDREIYSFSYYPPELQIELIQKAMKEKDPAFRLKKLIQEQHSKRVSEKQRNRRRRNQ